jgi:ribonuclease Z
MKPTFHHRLLHDPFGDPCLLIRILREKRSLLFDAGDLSPLTNTEVYRITDVFITHTHIDHFIGFDTLLRILLRRNHPLHLYGPPGIIANVQGKLKGYTWNLIGDYPTEILVHSFNGGAITSVAFRARDRFRKILLSKSLSDGVLLSTPMFSVRATKLDHGTPCLAYSIEEKTQLNIDKDRLEKKGLTVGPWLSDLKEKIRGNRINAFVTVEGKRHRVSNLLDIVRLTKGQKISFVTDVGLDRKNIDAIASLVKNSDILYCEAYFMEKDRQRALERFHLTAKETGLLARAAGVGKLALMHLSPKYRDAVDDLIKEAAENFGSEVLIPSFDAQTV